MSRTITKERAAGVLSDDPRTLDSIVRELTRTPNDPIPDRYVNRGLRCLQALRRNGRAAVVPGGWVGVKKVR